MTAFIDTVTPWNDGKGRLHAGRACRYGGLQRQRSEWLPADAATDSFSFERREICYCLMLAASRDELGPVFWGPRAPIDVLTRSLLGFKRITGELTGRLTAHGDIRVLHGLYRSAGHLSAALGHHDCISREADSADAHLGKLSPETYVFELLSDIGATLAETFVRLEALAPAAYPDGKGHWSLLAIEPTPRGPRNRRDSSYDRHLHAHLRDLAPEHVLLASHLGAQLVFQLPWSPVRYGEYLYGESNARAIGETLNTLLAEDESYDRFEDDFHDFDQAFPRVLAMARALV